MMSNNNILDFHKYIYRQRRYLRALHWHTHQSAALSRNRRLAYTLQGEGGSRGSNYRESMRNKGEGLHVGGAVDAHRGTIQQHHQAYGIIIIISLGIINFVNSQKVLHCWRNG
jgi:hypothetical protein